MEELLKSSKQTPSFYRWECQGQGRAAAGPAPSSREKQTGMRPASALAPHLAQKASCHRHLFLLPTSDHPASPQDKGEEASDALCSATSGVSQSQALDHHRGLHQDFHLTDEGNRGPEAWEHGQSRELPSRSGGFEITALCYSWYHQAYLGV